MSALTNQMHHQERRVTRSKQLMAARKPTLGDLKPLVATPASLPGNIKALSPNNLATVYCAGHNAATQAGSRVAETGC
jgi:hypothetical protein